MIRLSVVITECDHRYVQGLMSTKAKQEVCDTDNSGETATNRDHYER